MDVVDKMRNMDLPVESALREARGAAVKPIKPVVAPIPDDLAAQKKRQKDIARRYSKAGRAGTVLTSDNDKLG